MADRYFSLKIIQFQLSLPMHFASALSALVSFTAVFFTTAVKLISALMVYAKCIGKKLKLKFSPDVPKLSPTTKHFFSLALNDFKLNPSKNFPNTP